MESTEHSPETAQTCAIDLGRWIGRGETLGMLARKCTSAEALCLRALREGRHYESLQLTWGQFCSRYLGIHRSTADRIIQYLEEFGAGYFHLSQILSISPEAYRRIAPSVDGETIDLGGEPVPITPENAARIAAEIRRLRKQLALEDARVAALRPMEEFELLRQRLQSCLADLTAIRRKCKDRHAQFRIEDYIQDLIHCLNQILAAS